jgi:circadian clock protein KaiC
MDNHPPKCGSGVPGLDSILCGGLPRDCIFLVDGNPGVGKTTIALQFLLEGVREKERCLYVTLSETKLELEAVARSHGWDLSGIDIIELSAIESAMAGKLQNTMFQSAEVELTELSRLLLAEIERSKPSRVVLDSLSEMRLLAQNPLRYRRQILSFKQKLTQQGCTTLLLDDRSAVGQDVQVQSIVHGMISLEMAPLKYGVFRRFLSITKLRGVGFREGGHDYAIHKGGLRVYPRLVASEHHTPFKKAAVSSGNQAFDNLVGGGFDSGTSNLLIGPAGSGKSTVSAMFAHAAALRGERVCYYAFDESVQILIDRANEMKMDFRPLIESRRLRLQQIDPAEVAPGQLTYDIMQAVEHGNARVVVLDSLNGYVNAMPHEEFIYLHLHELLSYLNQQGVMTIMVLAQHGLIGNMAGPVDVSYLADTVVLTRFFEARGSVKQAISVIKKRSGPHEKTIRELSMSETGIHIGDPLKNFEGVLTGVPRFLGGGGEGLDTTRQ